MSLRPTLGRASMLRTRWSMRKRRLEIALAASGLVLPATLPVAALEPSYNSSSTLDSHVPPQSLHLDATIASMVKRGVIVDVSTPTTQPVDSLKPVVKPAVQPGRTQWRPAAQGARTKAVAAPRSDA